MGKADGTSARSRATVRGCAFSEPRDPQLYRGCGLLAAAALLGATASARADPVSTNREALEQSEAATPAARIEDDDQQGTETEQIVVTGSGTPHALVQSPVATELISRRAIDITGAGDVAELLSSHRGVELTEGIGGTGVRLQGLSPKHVLILVDGERVPGRIDGTLDLQRFTTADVERIEVVKGSSSALYGSDALGGVVNIITREADKPLSLTGVARYGNYRSADLSTAFASAVGPWNTRLSAGWRRRDRYDLDPRDAGTEGRDFSAMRLGAKIKRKIGERDSVTLRTSLMREGMQGLDNDGARVFETNKHTSLLSAAVAPVLHFGSSSKLTLSAHYSLFDDAYLSKAHDERIPDQRQNTRQSLSTMRAQLSHRPAAGHQLVVGADGAFETMNSDRMSPKRRTRSWGAVFLQDEWSLSESPGLTLVGGVRIDKDSQFGVATSPKISARFDIDDRVVVRGSYARGFRAPAFKEQWLLFAQEQIGFVAEGDPDLKPERAENTTASVEILPIPQLSLFVSGFYNKLDDLIQLARADPIGRPMRYQYVNVARARTTGVEASVRIGSSVGARLELGYTFTRARDLSADRPLEGRSRHRANVGASYDYRPWSLSLSGRASHHGKRPYFLASSMGQPGRQFADPFTLLAVRVAKRLDNYEVALSGDNMLNAGDPTFLPIVPRRFFVHAARRY